MYNIPYMWNPKKGTDELMNKLTITKGGRRSRMT